MPHPWRKSPEKASSPAQLSQTKSLGEKLAVAKTGAVVYKSINQVNSLKPLCPQQKHLSSVEQDEA
ncbi:MAG: hypothetical protein QXU45_01640 [Candidatus Bathyarchaeia archaeon]